MARAVGAVIDESREDNVTHTKQSTHHVSEIDRSIKHALTVVQYQRDSRLRGDQLPAISDREWYGSIVFTAKWPVNQVTLSSE